MNFDFGLVLTLLTYLVFITAFIVRVEHRVKSLESFNLDYKEHIRILNELKNEFVQLKAELKYSLFDKLNN